MINRQVVGGGTSLLRSRISHSYRPLAVSWAVTSRCNLCCTYCNIWNEKTTELNTAEALRMVNEMASAGTLRLSLTGGEPLLRRDIGTIISSAKRKGIKVSMNSNGLLVKDMLSDIEKLDMLSVSLDGPKRVHDLHRGKGSYEKVLNGIKAAKRYGLNVHVLAVVTRYNVNLLHEILAIADELDTEVLFQPVESYTHSSDVEKLSPPQKELESAFSQIIGQKRVLNSKSCLMHFIKPKINSGNCGASRIFCRVDPDGSILPCGRGVLLQNPPNVRQGFLNGFNLLPKPSCSGCFCASQVEASLLLGLNLDAIRSQLGSQLIEYML